MQNILNITLIQTHLYWENKKANLDLFSNYINTIKKTDLIILPEMYTTGFTMQPEKYFEDMQGETQDWMKQKTREKNCAIAGSIIVKENDKFYNRLLWVDEKGHTMYYDKRHLFRMAGEDKHYAAGKEKIIINYKGWNICPLICYDLRFPVWSRNKFMDDHYEYDLLIYVANWPEPRNQAWKILLQARAIENLCYVAGVNRIGLDGNNINHTGDSMLVNYKGEIMTSLFPSETRVETVEIKKDELNIFREKFPAGHDADSFIINV